MEATKQLSETKLITLVISKARLADGCVVVCLLLYGSTLYYTYSNLVATILPVWVLSIIIEVLSVTEPLYRIIVKNIVSYSLLYTTTPRR